METQYKNLSGSVLLFGVADLGGFESAPTSGDTQK